MFNYKEALTHGGKFHADDVFGGALIKLLNPDIVINRAFKVDDSIDTSEVLVFDIGLGKFDHHQADNEVRENGIPYAAFGKLWREFGPQLCLSKRAWDEVEETLVQRIDWSDNTGESNPLSLLISHMNPVWDATEPLPDDNESYKMAVDFAVYALRCAIDTANSKERARSYVKENSKIYNEGTVLILDKFVPWQDIVINEMPEVLYVIYPSNRGGYNVQVVPKEMYEPDPRAAFPYEWWGNPVKDLGMTFCHPSGFLLSAETLEEAKKIAEIAVKLAGGMPEDD